MFRVLPPLLFAGYALAMLTSRGRSPRPATARGDG
jgi:hypothetical protein